MARLIPNGVHGLLAAHRSAALLTGKNVLKDAAERALRLCSCYAFGDEESIFPSGFGGSSPPAPRLDPDDPQKGQWAGSPSSNGRMLSASVTEETSDWFNIVLRVRANDGSPLFDEPVEFHLHPTFTNSVVRVTPANGIAELRLSAWGSFTVGVSADNGRTRLELDLSKDPSFPKTFRER